MPYHESKKLVGTKAELPLHELSEIFKWLKNDTSS